MINSIKTILELWALRLMRHLMGRYPRSARTWFERHGYVIFPKNDVLYIVPFWDYQGVNHIEVFRSVHLAYNRMKDFDNSAAYMEEHYPDALKEFRQIGSAVGPHSTVLLRKICDIPGMEERVHSKKERLAALARTWPTVEDLLFRADLNQAEELFTLEEFENYLDRLLNDSERKKAEHGRLKEESAGGAADAIG